MASAFRVATALKTLPPFPPVVGRVIRLLADDSVSFREIADTLGTDSALSAEVLRLANSPLFGARYGVSSVLHALAVLGVKRLTGLILTLGISRFLKSAKAMDAMRRCWRHNLACAVAAREFAHSFSRDANEAYNAGLFHDIGRLAFLVVDPAFYMNLGNCAVELPQLELARFGVDHCQAGAWVIEHWQLPEAFVDVALFHHAPLPESSELVMLVNASCTVANRLGYAVVPAEAAEGDMDSEDPLCATIAEFIDSLEREYRM